jgi:ketosteroid isomerase-like protein
VGAEAKRKNGERVFAVYERPLDCEIRDLTITVGGDVAFVHSPNRLSGTLKSGTTSREQVLTFRSPENRGIYETASIISVTQRLI